MLFMTIPRVINHRRKTLYITLTRSFIYPPNLYQPTSKEFHCSKKIFRKNSIYCRKFTNQALTKTPSETTTWQNYQNFPKIPKIFSKTSTIQDQASSIQLLTPGSHNYNSPTTQTNQKKHLCCRPRIPSRSMRVRRPSLVRHHPSP